MSKYTYNVFPLIFVILGYGLIGLSVYSGINSIDLSAIEDSSESIVGALGFLGIGLSLITFRSHIMIDANNQLILKEYRILGGRLSKEKIRIPKDADEILIIPKKKQGKGYFRAVIQFGYNINSYDMYFGVNGGVVQIIKTDRKRAIRIAELINKTTDIEYSIKNNYDSQH